MTKNLNHLLIKPFDDIKEKFSEIGKIINEIYYINSFIKKQKQKKQIENSFSIEDEVENEEIFFIDEINELDFLDLIQLNALKIEKKEKILFLLLDIFKNNIENLDLKEKEYLNILYNLITKEIIDNNDFGLLEELLKIENISQKKLIKFSIKEEKNKKNIISNIKKFSRKIDNYLSNLNIKIDFETTFFLYLIFLYLKNN